MDHRCEINDFSEDVVCKYVQVILQYSKVFKAIIAYPYLLHVWLLFTCYFSQKKYEF